MRITRGLNIITPLDQVSDRRSCGPKAAAIGRLQGRGFAVPDGFCLGMDACKSHLWATGARSLARENPDAASREAIRRAITESDLAPDIEAALSNAYAALGDDVAVAVRHSASDDNVMGAAYATRIGVEGLSALIAAVKNVWASLWSEEAAMLREARPSGKEPSMAVIIQKLVDAEVSGVVVGANPDTGNPNEIYVSSSWGILVNPHATDDVLVDLANFKIISTEIGVERALTRLGSDGPQTVPCPPEKTKTPSLSPERISEIAEASVWIDEAFGAPQIVRWAHDGERLLIISARPVEQAPDYFPISENEPIGSGFWRISSPRPVSRLGQSLLALEPAKTPSLPSAQKGVSVCCHNGRVYRKLQDSEGKRGSIPALRDIIAGGWLYRRWKSDAETITRESRRDLDRPLSKLSTGELASALSRAAQRAQLSLQWYESIPVTSLRFSGLLRDMLAWVGAQRSLLTRLLLAHDSTRIELDDAFQRLSAYKWQAETGDGDPSATEPIAENIATRFAYVFENSGDAFDPASWKSWTENPDRIIQMASTLARGPIVDVVTARAEATSAAKDAEKAALLALGRGIGQVELPFARLKFRLLLQRTRAWLCAESERNHVHAMALCALRTHLMELGRRLVDAGALGSPDDVFHLTVEEIGRHASSGKIRADEMRRTVAHRKHEMWLQERLDPPSILPVSVASMEDQPPPSGARIMVGIPAVPGEVVGSVRVARSFREAAAARPGEILVAEDIPPAWTPILTIMAGIVIERKETLSPGADAARDYGIPCVTGVSRATSALHTANLVLIDGNSGRVEIVKQ